MIFQASEDNRELLPKCTILCLITLSETFLYSAFGQYLTNEVFFQ
jgi:hypothetical protein